MKEKVQKSLVDKILPIVVLVVFGLMFGFGALWQKVTDLEKRGATGTTTTTTQQTGQQAPTVTIDQIKAVFDNKNVITMGDKNSKLLLVEVADPSCPYCHVAAGHDAALNNAMGPNFKLAAEGGSYVPPVQEFKKLVDSGKAAFAYIYTPGHGNGEMGTKALYCANEQGKFWPVHDLLMSAKGYEILNGVDVTNTPTKGPIVKNDKTKSGDLANFLKSAIDATFLKNCLDSGKYDSRLSEDTQVAQTLGVQGTPGFFVNATNFPGAYSFSDMQTAVNSAI
jgi:protein-disulfide isomerase